MHIHHGPCHHILQGTTGCFLLFSVFEKENFLLSCFYDFCFVTHLGSTALRNWIKLAKFTWEDIARVLARAYIFLFFRYLRICSLYFLFIYWRKKTFLFFVAHPPPDLAMNNFGARHLDITPGCSVTRRLMNSYNQSWSLRRKALWLTETQFWLRDLFLTEDSATMTDVWVTLYWTWTESHRKRSLRCDVAQWHVSPCELRSGDHACNAPDQRCTTDILEQRERKFHNCAWNWDSLAPQLPGRKILAKSRAFFWWSHQVDLIFPTKTTVNYLFAHAFVCKKVRFLRNMFRNSFH